MYFTLAEAEARTEVAVDQVAVVTAVVLQLGLLDMSEHPTQAVEEVVVTAARAWVEQVVPVLLSLGTQRTLLQHLLWLT
jgi:hypothetical protein